MGQFDQLVESFRSLGLSDERARQAAIGRDLTESAARTRWDGTTGQATGVAPLAEAVRSGYAEAVATARTRLRMSEADAHAYVGKWVSDSLSRLVREAKAQPGVRG